MKVYRVAEPIPYEGTNYEETFYSKEHAQIVVDKLNKDYTDAGWIGRWVVEEDEVLYAIPTSYLDS